MPWPIQSPGVLIILFQASICIDSIRHASLAWAVSTVGVRVALGCTCVCAMHARPYPLGPVGSRPAGLASRRPRMVRASAARRGEHSHKAPRTVMHKDSIDCPACGCPHSHTPCVVVRACACVRACGCFHRKVQKPGGGTS